MFGKRTVRSGDAVRPDLPITPMLDMSFQLMAFFVFTFRPMPTEGQIRLDGPLPGKDMDAFINLDRDLERRERAYLTVTVDADDNGHAVALTIVDDVGSKTIAAAEGSLLRELNARTADWKPGRLTIVMPDRLIYGAAMRLMDEGLRAGFTDINPTRERGK